MAKSLVDTTSRRSTRKRSRAAFQAPDDVSPDHLSDLLERHVDQKLHGAYFTPATITTPLCEKTIGRAIVDAVNAASPRKFDSVAQLLGDLDDATATLVLDTVLPELAVLDPACGAGAFLVAAMKTLCGLYRDVFTWIERGGGDVLRPKLDALRTEHGSLNAFSARRVLDDNLFGVDLMPEAVETTRRRLRFELESAGGAKSEPGVPIHVVAGNALLGAIEAPASVAATQRSYDEHLLDRFRALGIRYERSTWDPAAGKPGPAQRRPMALEHVTALRPLHWPLAFEAVMRRGGFDVVLANPPWDVLKPNGKEFFEAHSDLVTKKSMSIHDFETEQARLLLDDDIRHAWLDYLSRFQHQSAYFRAAPEYTHQSAIAGGRRVGSDLNLYKLFTERCYRLLRDGGHCGMVVPSGIYTDLGAKGLREMLFARTAIESLFCIENREGVFGDVHRMFKFVVLGFRRGGETQTFPAAFMRRDVAELKHFPEHCGVTIDVELVRRLSPDSLSVMEFKSELDVAIARKMSRFPLLGEDLPGRWKLRLTREFDMTNDGRLFRTSPGAGRLPLFEGKMVWQFDNRFAEPRYWIDEGEGRAALTSRRSTDQPSSFAWQRPRFAIRAVASNVNARTLIAAIVPANHFCGNSLLVDSGLREAESLYLLGVMNSFVLDWLMRQKITTNVNMFQIYQLPVPRLVAGDAAFDAISALARRVLDDRYDARLRAELDAAVARLYGLIGAEFAHVLAAFPIVDANVRDDVLSAYVEAETKSATL